MMKNMIFGVIILALMLSRCTPTASDLSNTENKMEMITQEKQAAEMLLKNYESALKASDTKAIVKLYTDDGVFMPADAPTSIGQEAVTQAYDFVFSQIKLKIEFFIDEIEIHGDFAFARTISRGMTDVLAQGITVPEENRELFVLQKIDGHWKIARYIFNKMSPPQ